MVGAGARIARLRVHEGEEKRTYGLLESRTSIPLTHWLAID